MFEAVVYMIFAIIGGVIMYWVISALVKVPAREVESKRQSMGELKGKTKAEVIRVMGPPNSVSVLPQYPRNGQLLQWIKSGYHIAVAFDADDICQGITHEFRS